MVVLVTPTPMNAPTTTTTTTREDCSPPSHASLDPLHDNQGRVGGGVHERKESDT